MVNKFRNQRATAIITAILVVSIISIAAITMQAYLYGELNRTQMVIDGDNLLNDLYGVEAWGMARVKNLESKNEKQSNQHAATFSNKHFNKYEYAAIYNQNSLFNINYLYNLLKCSNRESGPNQKIVEKIFEKIISNTDVGMSAGDISALTLNIQKWMCTKPLLVSDELKDYSGSTIAPAWTFLPSGQVFADITELRLIPGVTEQLYNNMQDNLTVFPIELKNNNVQVKFTIDNLNINIFAALAGIDNDAAASFLETIKNLDSKKKIEKINQFITDQKIYSEQELKEINNMISADEKNDSYYKIISKARIGNYEIDMQTSVNKDSKNNMHILWRKRGIING